MYDIGLNTLNARLRLRVYILSALEGVSNRFLLLFLRKTLPRAFLNGLGEMEIRLSFFLLITSLHSS